MSLADIQRRIKEDEAELARLRDERARLKPGDTEGASRLRAFITTTAENLEELKADAAAIEKREKSAERTAQRAAGREALAKVKLLQPVIADKFAALVGLIGQAVVVARELDAGMQEANAFARAVVKAHHDRDHQSLINHGFSLVPAAMASTGPVGQAIAFELVSLLDAIPASLNVSPQYLVVNRSALPSGAEPAPILASRVLQAFAGFNARAADMCVEPVETEEGAAA